MWLKSKSSLKRERKKLVPTKLPELLASYTAWLWRAVVLLTSPVLCESLSKDAKGKANRKCQSEAMAQWTRSGHYSKESGADCHRRGAAWGPWASQGALGGWRGCGAFILGSLFTCVCPWEHSLVLVCVFLQFGQTVQDRYLSSFPQRPDPGAFPLCILYWEQLNG